MYYIGLLLLLLIIVPYLVFYKKEKSNIEDIEGIQPVDDSRLRDIAMHLPGQIGYLNNERRVSYRFDIDRIINTITSFYSSFDAKYEDYIEHSRELLNNRLQVQNSIQKLKDIRADVYYLNDSVNYNKSAIEAAVSYFLPLCGYRIDKNRIVSFITSYQFVKTMKYKEIYSFINIIKIKLMDKLSQICRDIDRHISEYDSVNDFVGKLVEAPEDLPAYESETRKIADRKQYSYLVKLNIALLQNGVSVGGYYKTFSEQLNGKGINIENITLQYQKLMSEKSAVCANIINSLRSLDVIDMTDFIKSVSYTESILLKDPVGIYIAMTEDTKRDYRLRIQKISSKLDKSEFDVAAMSLKLARESDNHVGAYLYGNRRLNELYKKFKHKYKKKPAPGLVFYSAVVAAMFILGGLFAWFIIRTGGSYASAVILPLISLPLFYRASYWAAGRMAEIMLFDNQVPMLEMDDIPESAKTMAIIPVLAISKEQIKDVIKTLEIIKLTNSYKAINYALVVDYKASEKQQGDNDADMRDFIIGELKALNDKYGNRFFYFSRNKTYNPMTKLFEPWERKRGAIIEFNKLLLEGSSDSFNIKKLDKALTGTRFVATFDEDTRITHGEILKMVGAMHHPLNKPCISNGKITAGYTILQPRIRTKLDDANVSSFTRAFSGSHGYDHYSNSGGSLNTRLYNKGMYFGKGIYSVLEFNQLLAGVFPDNRILSHDMIEGEIAGCGFINATIYEGFPSSIEEYFNRFERWLRGDFQLFPWLFRKTRDRDMEKINNPLCLCSKAGVLNNMLQYLVSPSALAGIILSILLGTLFQYAAFILMPVVVYMLFKNLAALVKYRRFRAGNMLEADRALLTLALLPLRAWITIRGIALVACRLAANSPKLMQWSTAASYKHSKNNEFDFFKMMWPSYLIPVAGLVSLFIWPSQSLYAMFTGMLFLVLVFVAFAENRPDPKEDREPTEDQKEFLARLLEKTYKYFEDFSDGTTGLICDNYQEKHKVGAARRTSPTNIGFSLIGHCIALDNKLISVEVFRQRINKVINTLLSLEKWHGNLFNWYVTTDGSLLHPRYVSTVDSGNLKVSLIYLYEYINRLELSTFDEILYNVKSLFDNMNLTKLYNYGRKQFYIGYNLDTDSFSDSHYDLYMSESRLTSIAEIALGNVPVAGWDSLSRNDNCIKGRITIMSWGGSTFEYLMPTLFLPVYEHSFEDQAISNYLSLQLEYCNKLKIPMGISESGYNDEDLDKNYQYRSFGIPGAGYRRDIETDVVCAPYAAILALEHMPDEIMNALYQYMAIGASGSYGMYEAVDFTKSRLESGQEHQVIQSYMAHHQGMIMTAIHNYLNGNTVKQTIMDMPWMQTIKILLQEQKVDGCSNKVSIINLNMPPEAEPEDIGSVAIYRNLEPKTHFPTGWLSNGDYHMAVSIDGSGYSRLKEYMLNRGSREALDNGTGTYAFLYSGDKTYSFSANIGAAPQRESFRINIGSIVFDKKFEDFHIKTNIYVSPGENIEIRKYSIKNLTDETKHIGLKIYSDIEMSLPEAYGSHRVYQNLFIESINENNGIHFSRRKRCREENVPYMVLKLIGLNESEKLALANDREKALGRYNSIRNADFHTGLIEWSQTAVDHCALIQAEVNVEPGDERFLYLLQIADFDQAKCASLAAKYSNTEITEYAISQAAPAQRARYRFHLIEGRHLRLINKLLPALLYGNIYPQGSGEGLLENKLSLKSLWRLGVSGKKPIIMADIYSESTLARLEHLFKINSLLYGSGIDFDFVVVNHINDSYENLVRDGIYKLRDLYGNAGNLKIVGINMIGSEELSLLKAITAADFSINIPLTVQYDYYLSKNIEYKGDWAQTLIDETYLEYSNGYGGFDEDTDDYVINIIKGVATPMPWSNILTNGEMGAILTEKGISYLWYKNSREMPLTKWRNDPVRDMCPVSFRLYKNGAFIYEFGSSSVGGNWQVVHSRGYSTYGTTVENLKVLTTVVIDINSDSLVINIDIQNMDSDPADIAIEFNGNFVMGGSSGRNVISGFEGNVLYVKNHVDINMSGQTLYILNSMLKEPEQRPAPSLGGYVNSRCSFIIEPAGKGDCSIILSMNKKTVDFHEIFESVKEYWEKRKGVFKVNTPDMSLNIMINSWLQYQTISSRIMGRCGYYQSGGAYGFRDQLQDALSLLWASPMIMRNMLVDFAEHQFLSGDVQHWWHNPSKGVRTRIKDDMLFLVYGVCEYIDNTQDYSILEESAEYLKDVEIRPGEDDWYGMPDKSGMRETILQHCMRAIDRCCVYGRYGLPLIEGGDWNDGFNKVGNKGLGESVWLGFFMYYLMKRFYEILIKVDEHNEAEIMMDRINYLGSRLRDSAWDGKWYKRAFMDDGTPLGSEKSLECKIDCLSQSWAVISGIADSIKGNMALDSVFSELYDKKNDILKLMAPPLDSWQIEPGYIKGYIPGVRENGAQYTHAALWMVWALALAGRGNDACKLMHDLIPINHSLSKAFADKYKTEPYVLAADVYSAPGQEGRGGWTWYTGSAAWMYKIAIEHVLGIKKQGERLFIDPCISEEWVKYDVQYKFMNTYYDISIKNSDGRQSGIKSIVMDGKECSEGFIELINDAKEHKIYVTM